MPFCIALIGRTGSGKDVFVDYAIKKHGLVGLKFSAVLTELAQELNIVAPGTTLKQKQQYWGPFIRKNYGVKLYVERIVQKVKGKNAVVNGVRSSEEFTLMNELLGEAFIPVSIVADFDVRLSRVQERGKEFSFKTLDEFKASEAKQSESEINLLMEKRNIKVENNGTLEEFYAKIDALLAELLKK